MFASDRTVARELVVAVALLLGVASASFAQTPTREQEQLRRVRQQLQQTQQEVQSAQDQARRALEAQKKADAEKLLLEAQVKRGGAAVGAARNEAAASARRVGELESALAAMKAEHDSVQARWAETASRLEQTVASLKQANERLAAREAALAELEARHKVQTARLDAAIRNNLALYGLGRDLLARYQNKSVAESLSAQEPILQFGRVELENLVQDYRDRLDKDRIPPGAKAP
jgi:chromosome segregation ATPase